MTGTVRKGVSVLDSFIANCFSENRYLQGEHLIVVDIVENKIRSHEGEGWDILGPGKALIFVTVLRKWFNIVVILEERSNCCERLGKTLVIVEIFENLVVPSLRRKVRPS